ncbi:MAG: cellobiose phosphorylase [Paraglaciecola sp.]|jgi:cellobiose phosphorylase
MSIENSLAIKNNFGLQVEFDESGLISAIKASPIQISLNSSLSTARFSTNLYLRNHSTGNLCQLLGNRDSSFFVTDNQYQTDGVFEQLGYLCRLTLNNDQCVWTWTVEVTNLDDTECEFDVIYGQDVGLSAESEQLNNEYYVSQYIERRVFTHATFGEVICCRQNLAVDGTHPWLLLAAKTKASSASVDGLQFFGSDFRNTNVPAGLLNDELPGEYAGELAFVGLKAKNTVLGAKHEKATVEFCGIFLFDHPNPTSVQDLDVFSDYLRQPTPVCALSSDHIKHKPNWNLLKRAPGFVALNLSTENILKMYPEQHQCEKMNGKLMSFFSADRHIVLREKERVTERPHGHIMQAKTTLFPTEEVMSTTALMAGVFNSHITQGNTTFNKLMTICPSQFNVDKVAGQRILVDTGNGFRLLGVPSLFEMGSNSCKWIYHSLSHTFQVRTWTSPANTQILTDFTVLKGSSVNVLMSLEFEGDPDWELCIDNTQSLTAEPGAQSNVKALFPDGKFVITVDSDATVSIVNDECLYDDQQSRTTQLKVVAGQATTSLRMGCSGQLSAPQPPIEMSLTQFNLSWLNSAKDASDLWKQLSGAVSLHGEQHDWANIQQILPWFGHNAMVHFQTPHGLEQFNGAAWGTRDVVQGPFELLLSSGNYETAKRLLLHVFANQELHGGWPQWWMFDAYKDVRSTSAHADIHLWCLLALSNYLIGTNDFAVLDQVLPYYVKEPKGDSSESLIQHVERLISMTIDSYHTNTSLTTFGGGDWNDAMQPASKELANSMVSSWSVALNFQAFTAFMQVCERAGRFELASKLKHLCQNIQVDFNRYLIKDQVVCGHAIIKQDEITHLLHPSDEHTSIKYRLLPMIRGTISGIFTKAQSESHRAIIEEHLKGPDGARLMDRPPQYTGGKELIFRRGESSPYFGREIGLMYTHAHLRYAESLAISGQADGLLTAIRQVSPIEYREVVKCGNMRQANCYYSSSDVGLTSRFEANDGYDAIVKGEVELKGGWRIYSSGPGIFISLIISRLLGVRNEFEYTVIDPVLSKKLHGMSATLNYMGNMITFTYLVTIDGTSPKHIVINNTPVEFAISANQYRSGGAKILTSTFLNLLVEKNNIVSITL